MPAITFSRPRSAFIGVALACAAPVLWAAPAAGDAAPPLTVPGFGGASIDLASLRGKVVVLNFWASWCEPCRREMPLLQALAHDYADRVVVVGLSADDKHDRKEAQRVAQSVTYPMGLLADAQPNGFGMPAMLPLTYVIGPTGTVQSVLRASQGALTDAQLRSAVEAALHAGAGR
jgi:cytochrome c biogenesis protein CcmG/thiol:disulfide interchange protein DsbE